MNNIKEKIIDIILNGTYKHNVFGTDSMVKQSMVHNRIYLELYGDFLWVYIIKNHSFIARENNSSITRFYNLKFNSENLNNLWITSPRLVLDIIRKNGTGEEVVLN